MTMTTALSAKAMTALGAMALITLCFQTFNSSATPSHDTMTLDRLKTIDQQIATLRATMNHVLQRTDTTIPSSIKWPAQSPKSNDSDASQVIKIIFGLLAPVAWVSGLVTFYSEIGSAADRTMAAGMWGACAAFISLWFLGEPREWYGYLLGASWGFYAGMFGWRMFAENHRVAGKSQKA